MSIFWIIMSMLRFEVVLITSTLIIHSPVTTIETLIGGILGIVLFTQLGVDIEKWIAKRFSRKFKKFSWKNRMLVKLRRRWGLWGIALLTPIIIGIPIGVLLSIPLTTDKMKIIKPMVVSVIFWTSLFYFIGFLARL